MKNYFRAGARTRAWARNQFLNLLVFIGILMTRKAIFIAATGQNVGKTTLCLGILAGLLSRFKSVGFMKPVGQRLVLLPEGIDVDKDVVLFKEYFDIKSDWPSMSPVLCPSGFTREYLDGKVDEKTLLHRIVTSYQKISQEHDFVLVEGTGHTGVGSVFNLNNAQIAKMLGLEVVIIATGGLGSSIDELSLNIQMCKAYGVPIRGIILNRVIKEKRQMVLDYFPKYLKRHNIPLIGCIPFHPFLIKPTVKDFESLFDTQVLAGKKHRLRHFEEIRLIAGSLDAYLEEMSPNQLVITPASREDIIMATIERHMRTKLLENRDYESGMILTGQNPPRKELLKRIEPADIPILYAPLCSFDVMKMINSFTAKIQKDDTSKVEKAIQLVVEHVDFNLLCQ